jgi:hypothetical protein
MKKFLLPVTIALAFCTVAEAGTDIVALRSGGVARRDRNMYRPIPRGEGVNPNATASERARQTQYRPTQHYYLRDTVVSYRYTTNKAGSPNLYLGPKGAAFIPSEEQLSPHAGDRNYAAVTKRPQPGVPMIQRRPGDTKEDTAKTKSAASRYRIASADR